MLRKKPEDGYQAVAVEPVPSPLRRPTDAHGTVGVAVTILHGFNDNSATFNVGPDALRPGSVAPSACSTIMHTMAPDAVKRNDSKGAPSTTQQPQPRRGRKQAVQREQTHPNFPLSCTSDPRQLHLDIVLLCSLCAWKPESFRCMAPAMSLHLRAVHPGERSAVLASLGRSLRRRDETRTQSALWLQQNVRPIIYTPR